MPTYPSVYTFLTKNDMVVRVRPLLAEDAPYLVDLFENMSQDSRYSRFLQTLDNIDMERVWSLASDMGARVIAPFLAGEGVARLDGLVGSHSDMGHAGGVAARA